MAAAERKRKSKFYRGFKKESEQHAVDFRGALGLKNHEPLNAQALADHLNIPIFSPKDIGGLKKLDIDLLLKPNATAWSAVTIENVERKKIIIHNCSHSLARQESDIMHELAHIIRNHEMSEIGVARPDMPFLFREYKETEEEEAIWLGGCLQIPRCALVWAFGKRMSIEEIADYYKASKDMVTYRVNKEGIRNQFKRWS